MLTCACVCMHLCVCRRHVCVSVCVFLNVCLHTVAVCVCACGRVCVSAHSVSDYLMCEHVSVRVDVRVWPVHISVCGHGMLSHHLSCVGLCAPVCLSQCGPLGRYELHVSTLSVCCACLATWTNVCTAECGACIKSKAESAPAEPSSAPSCPQGCCPKAWSSALPLTTTRCAKVTTPPSGMGTQKVSHVGREAMRGTDSGPQHPHLSEGRRSGRHHAGWKRGFRGLYTRSLESTASGCSVKRSRDCVPSLCLCPLRAPGPLPLGPCPSSFRVSVLLFQGVCPPLRGVSGT